MAFNTNTGRNEYVASSGQTLFVANFKIFETTDIEVYLTPSGQTPDDTTDLLSPSLYTVEILGDTGANVTLNTGASTGDRITLVRNLPITRTTDYQLGGDLSSDTLDADQDLQTYLISDQNDKNNRSLQFPKSIQNVITELPSPVAGGYLSWNTEANGIDTDTSVVDSVSTCITKASEASASASSASTSEANALSYAESINPANLLHTVGAGAGDPEGYTTSEVDTALALKADDNNVVHQDNTDETKIGSLQIGESISITSWSYPDTTTITLNVASHNAKAGDTIYVSGLVSDTNAPNGTYTVDSVTATTIVYTASLTPTGTPTVSSALVKYGELKDFNGDSITRRPDMADTTVLADYPALNLNSTITLSESIQNFHYLLVDIRYSVATPNTIQHTMFLIKDLVVGEHLEFGNDDARYARWIYTNNTTFTNSISSGLSVRKIYGVGRK